LPILPPVPEAVSIRALVTSLASDLFEFFRRYESPALVTLVSTGAQGIAILIRSVRTPCNSG
jgi:hypothetical protein